MTEESLFAAAVAIPDPLARHAYLDRACAGKVELRKQLAVLVAAHFAPHPDLAPVDGTVTAPASVETADPDGTHSHQAPAGTAGAIVAGRYKLLQQIGEGGMGEVWMADQTEPVKRRVAVKLIRAERSTSKAVLTRFEAERQAIALMTHDNIAKLLDAGTTAEGVPYFVMELVRGVPLTQFCDEHQLSVPERLRLFVQICSAVQHAHQKGVIHRDLKPTNILVESHGGKPVPKVIDFGLAKAAGGVRLTDHTLFTGFGAVLGTPLYMAPEQATFDALDVDTRADIYALGVILYELLTGTTPLRRETVKKAAIDQVLKLIREQDAPTPSSRLSGADDKPTVAANRQTEPAKLGRFVKGELDWIVLKSLSKDRDRRYETANGFARDVERFLAHEPVTAGPPTAAYRLSKFVQRNRGRVIAAGVAAAAVLLGFAGTGAGLVEAKRQQDIAEGKQVALEAEQTKLVAKQAELKAEQGKLKERTAEAEAARRDADLELHDNQRVLLRAAWDAGETDKLKAVLDQMRPKAGRSDLRGFETHYLDRLAHAEVDRVAYEPLGNDFNGEVNDWWSPGRVYYKGKLAENQHYHTITATDLATGKPLDGFTPIQFRWNNQQIVPKLCVIPGDPPRVWTSGHIEPADWNETNELGFPFHDIRAWDARSGKQLLHCERLYPDPKEAKLGWRHRFMNMIFIGETADRAGTTVITQLVRGEKTADGTWTGLESRAQLHDLKTGKAVRLLDARPGAIDRAQFSPDDKFVVTRHRQAGQNGKPSYTFTVWDTATWTKVWDRDIENWDYGFTRDGTVVGFTYYGTDGKRAVIAQQALATGKSVPFKTVAPTELNYYRQPPDGLTVNTTENKLAVRDVRTGVLLDTFPSAAGPAGAGEGVPRHWNGDDGKVAVPWYTSLTSTLGAASTYRRPRAEVIPLPPLKPSQSRSVQFEAGEHVAQEVFGRHPSEANRLLAETCEVFNLTAGKSSAVPLRPEWNGSGMGVSSDGRTLVIDRSPDDPAPFVVGKPRTRSRSLVVCDVLTGKERFTAVVTKPTPVAAEDRSWRVDKFFDTTADGSRIVAVDPGGKQVLCWNVDKSDPLWEKPLPAEVAWPVHLILMPDASRAVLADATGVLRVLDIADGRLVTTTADGPKRAKETDQDYHFSSIRCGVTPDGRTAFFIDRQDLTLIDTADWSIRHRLGGDVPPAAPGDPQPAWLAVGDRFALWHTAANFEVWDVHTGKRVSRFDLSQSKGELAYLGEAQIQAVYTPDGSRAFILTSDSLRVIDLTRGREVVALPIESTGGRYGINVYGPAARLSLSGDGHEVTVTSLHPDRGVVLKRVFDARPLTDDELARGKRLNAIRPATPKPFVPPDQLPLKPPVTCSDYMDLAKRRLAEMKTPEAIAAYRAAIKLDDFAAVRCRLANVLRDSGDPDGALAEYRQAIKLAPRDFNCWYQIGLILQGRNERQGATAAFREAVAADTRQPTDAGVEVQVLDGGQPSRIMLLDALGWSLCESGELAEAEKVYRELEKRLEGEKELRQAMNLFPRPSAAVGHMAICLIRLKKAKEADAVCEAFIKRATALIPKDDANEVAQGVSHAQYPTREVAEAMNHFGWTFLREDRWEEAVVWADRTIRARDDYYKKWPVKPGEENEARHAHWIKAVAFNWLGKGKEAVEAIDESIKLAPDAEKLKQKTMRARYVAKSGDHAAAAKQVRELMKVPYTGIDPQWYHWDAALAYSLNSKTVAKGDAKLSEEYAKEAVRLLKKCLELRFDDLATMKKDKDLDPIRERDDFKKLLAELEKKLAPKPEK